MEPERKIGPLLSPCHGKPVYATPSGYTGLCTIWCSEPECLNTWDGDGNPEEP